MSIGGSRKWLSFLVCGQIATAGLVIGASDEFGRRVSAGIKIGVPLTQMAETGIPGNEMQTKRYTIGPVVDISLLRGVNIEVGAMYKRINQQGTAAILTGYVDLGDDSYYTRQFYRVFAAGRSWEFPIAAQYHFKSRSIRPYIEGGLSYNHLTNIYGYWNPGLFDVGSRFEPTHNVVDRRGLLFGVGADIKHHFIHLSPGIRLTRYPTRLYDTTVPPPGTNSVDFLVGFRF